MIVSHIMCPLFRSPSKLAANVNVTGKKVIVTLGDPHEDNCCFAPGMVGKEYSVKTIGTKVNLEYRR